MSAIMAFSTSLNEKKGLHGEREPEAYVLLGIDHTDLAGQRTTVDEEVEPLKSRKTM
jgi:hypothetical protein